MADQKVTDLSELSGLVAADDYVYIVDTSDTTDDAAGSSYKIKVENLSNRILIETITHASANEFDFASIPSVFSRLIVQGYVRSTEPNTADQMFMYFGTDTTGSNYWKNRFYSNSASATASEAAEAEIAVIPGDNSPTNAYAQVRIQIDNYAATSYLKGGFCQFAGYTDTNEVYNGICGMWHKTLTTAISRVRFQAQQHATYGLVGSLSLYGEF